ncbi:3-hydroxyacyl-CoA dehydrogenase NAD-binding domain-containing protein [Ideonella livida]|uniref:3-hydroxyacyl-CoA dehydrogenase n=1 Tax=Ideonella livida TaxID=2707176 RepID=A0A7C9PGE2_9BURK|nr:3-hydroxyacyl-CoA dehydrogenase NAD-binding domain-containing protein [Ideonella livida]NDY91236.1 3-hydroxyacyl-CoA dehydrogenase [Ideonella livida]
MPQTLVLLDAPNAQGVAVLRLNSPPLNTLGLPLRVALADALDAAAADPAIRALVLTGAHAKAFCGGGEIGEFGQPAMTWAPTPPDLCNRLEHFAKPVVAALQGLALGGGLELALACHGRVAEGACTVGLPEIHLGLLPGAGGTQRLPRLVAADLALNLILQGKTQPARALAESGLFNTVTEGDPLPAATTLAAQLADALAAGQPLPRTGARRPALANAAGFFAAARGAAQGRPANAAALKVIDLVEAAVTQPLAKGLAQEAEAFVQLVHGEASAGLRHAFFAEKAVAKLPGLDPATPTRPVERTAVVGAGTMGCGIAICLLQAGLSVTVLEQTPEALARGLANIRAHFDGAVAKGRLKPEQAAAHLARLHGTTADADLADADLLIEAVFEDWAVKEAVFRRLDAVAKPGALLASNTSTLDLNRVAAFTQRPQDVLGLHFFSPAQLMPLLEIIECQHTAPDALATALALAKRIGKVGVVSRVCDGFIGNRMLEPYLRQAGFLLDEGATPAQVDGAMERWGMAMGPFRMSDLAGHDVGAFIRRRRQAEHPDLTFSRTADLVFEAGRLGQKNGKGWYDHVPGEKRPRPSAEVQQLIEAESTRLGLTRRAIADDEIVERLLLALVNEGAKLLAEGIARRGADIDVVYLHGYGFARWRGGPMWQAERLGLPGVLQAMRRHARGPAYQNATAFWTPAPLLVQLAESGAPLTAYTPS